MLCDSSGGDCAASLPSMDQVDSDAKAMLILQHTMFEMETKSQIAGSVLYFRVRLL